MAAKKASNSNKTAHVMNLLSRNREQASQEEAEQTAAQPAGEAQPAAPASQVNNLMSALHPDATVSAQIKSALEADLATEEPAPAAPQEAPQAAPVQEAQPEPREDPEEAFAELQPEEVPAFDQEAAAEQAIAQGLDELEQLEQQAEQPAPDEPQPVRMASSPVIRFEDPNANIPYGELVYVNVMQQLVEESAPKYMRLYGVCNCPRCQVDVKALALSGLPSKYVVMRKGEMVPRISVYEGRYSAAVTAQLLWACKLVTEKPHHGR